jgi:hypothetical protein
MVRVPWVQSHVFTGDDRALGMALYEAPSPASEASRLQVNDEDRERIGRCQRFALEIYDHAIPAMDVTPFPGWATPAEKAFYKACIEGPSQPITP